MHIPLYTVEYLVEPVVNTGTLLPKFHICGIYFVLGSRRKYRSWVIPYGIRNGPLWYGFHRLGYFELLVRHFLTRSINANNFKIFHKKLLPYQSVLIQFMSYKDGTQYEEDRAFTDAELGYSLHRVVDWSLHLL